MGLRTGLCCALLLMTLLPLSANASSKLYVVYMGEKKHDDPAVVTASHHDVLTSVLGSYRHGFSGFAAMLTESQAEILAVFPEVVSVKPSTYHKMHTTRSWDFLGMDYNQPPQQSGALLQKAKYGEDVIVGVIDTGIWPESRSFDDAGYGPIPARWKGKCQAGAVEGQMPGRRGGRANARPARWKGKCQAGAEFNVTSCNRKIIGARWYSEGADAEDLKGEYISARDLNGHGTHVASTIAGAQVWNASFNGLGSGVARGGAPRARLAIYKAMWGNSGNEAGILKAIDDAINDGVDRWTSCHSQLEGPVNSSSAASPSCSPAGTTAPCRRRSFNALPWVTTVAASTIDRSFPTVLSLGNKEKLVGQSFYSAYSSDFQELVWMSTLDNSTTNVTGKIVLYYAPTDKTSLGTLPRVTIGQVVRHVVKAGAKGLVFAQYTENLLDALAPLADILPCVLVDFEIARRIVFYVSNTRTAVMKISPAVTVVGNGVLSPRIAGFSSRGPSATFPALLKPDVAAPGVSILAAQRDSYVFLSGTSMVCPHASAVTALLKSVHGDWSPAMIKSAIITTSSVTDGFGAPIEAEGLPRKLADPFDFGGSHMNPDRAVDPGLVYDIDTKDFSMFLNCTRAFSDCGTYMVQLYQLNLPSIALPQLQNTVTVRRTVTNVGPEEATYRAVVEAPTGVTVSVEPSVIKFSKSGSRSMTFKVTFTAKRRVQGGYTFGSLTWVDGNTHSVRIPIATRIVIQDTLAVADVSKIYMVSSGTYVLLYKKGCWNKHK